MILTTPPNYFPIKQIVRAKGKIFLVGRGPGHEKSILEYKAQSTSNGLASLAEKNQSGL